jgi:hypothetical protein
LFLRDLRQPPLQLDKLGRRPVRRRTGRRELVLVGLSCSRVLFLVSLPPCPLGRELVLELLLISPPRHALDGKIALKTRNLAFQLGRRPVRTRPLGDQLGPFAGEFCRRCRRRCAVAVASAASLGGQSTASRNRMTDLRLHPESRRAREAGSGRKSSSTADQFLEYRTPSFVSQSCPAGERWTCFSSAGAELIREWRCAPRRVRLRAAE